tara:strand:- start:95 stop:310 length:216 start_codon:yes stop_codon:yes gene_type:complete
MAKGKSMKKWKPTRKNIADQWLSVRDVCAYTGLSASTIHRATKNNWLKVSSTTGKNLFKRSWVDRFLGEEE